MDRIPTPVLIIAAGSDIGRALARRYAAAGCPLILAARHVAALADDRTDLQIRYRVRVEIVECDVTDRDPDRFFAALPEVPGTIVMVAGLLGDQAAASADSAIAAKVMTTNYTGPALFLLAAARLLEERRGGCIIGISSVAGERGRASNFIYGSAKAGLSALLSGLRNRLAKRGVHVLTVKPGFVATRMTAGMDLPKRLTAQPSEVAAAIIRAQQQGKDILYIKPVWRLIMLIIAVIPERIFKRLSL
jgi:decaprenylphospho-beta-D-erythro-pentofuranosid-2-ulose 2-reductase